MNYRIDEKLARAILTDIRWERIFVRLDLKLEFSDTFTATEPLDFFAVNTEHRAMAKFRSSEIEKNLFRLELNVSNSGENQCFPTGIYRILICHGEDILAECECDYSCPVSLEEKGKNFMYANGKGVYATDFYIEEDADNLPFRIRTLIARRVNNKFPENPSANIFSPNFFRYLKNKRVLIRNCYSLLRSIYGKRSQNTILFMTEQGSELKSNLKAVHDRMLERGMDREYKILTSARSTSSSEQSFMSWFSLIKKLAQSSLVFLDDHAPMLDWLKLSDDTEVVQLWHAGAGFKSSGYSRWGHQGCPSPQSCHRQYSYGIAGSRNIAPFFSEVWGINNELVLPTGMPRMDEFLNEDYRAKTIEKLYQEFPVCKGKKVVLFAPTYRGKNKKTAFYPYHLIDFDRFYKLCGDEYVVLFKMHPWVSASVPVPENYRDLFIDVNNYPNINDLFYITDLLITDYSSSIFEYSLMNKPMMFFAYDKLQYSFSRGFHRPYEESAPGKVCYTFSELMDAFENRDFEYEKVAKYVKHHFDFIDSHSSDRVIDWIVKKQLPENLRKEIDLVRSEMERMHSLDFTPPFEEKTL